MTHIDYDALQGSIRAIYSDLNSETFPASAITVLSKIIPSDVSNYNEIKPGKEGGMAVYRYFETPAGYIGKKEVPIFVEYMHEHPYINILSSGQRHPFKDSIESKLRKALPDYRSLDGSRLTGRALKVSDVLSNNQFQRLGLYNEFFRKFNLKYQMVITLNTNPSIIGITFNRDAKDFSERERLIVNLLAPHIIQAFQNAEEVSRIQNKAGIERPGMEEWNDLLTPREEEVLYWVAQGKGNQDTAIICSMSEKTVKKHLEQIYRKLGIENRYAAARLVMEALYQAPEKTAADSEKDAVL